MSDAFTTPNRGIAARDEVSASGQNSVARTEDEKRVEEDEPEVPSFVDYCDERSLVEHIVKLERRGWNIVEIRPDRSGGRPALWYLTAERCDSCMTMSSTAVDPEAALAELVRYTQPDRRPSRHEPA